MLWTINDGVLSVHSVLFCKCSTSQSTPVSSSPGSTCSSFLPWWDEQVRDSERLIRKIMKDWNAFTWLPRSLNDPFEGWDIRILKSWVDLPVDIFNGSSVTGYTGIYSPLSNPGSSKSFIFLANLQNVYSPLTHINNDNVNQWSVLWPLGLDNCALNIATACNPYDKAKVSVRARSSLPSFISFVHQTK